MVDQVLSGLFGAKDDDEPEVKRSRAKDFVDRFEQGSPYEGYSTEEAVQNFRQVTKGMAPNEFEEAASQAFEKMPPEDRSQFGKLLQQGGAKAEGGLTDNPRDLAKLTSQLHQQDDSAGGLSSLFSNSGGLGGLLGGMTGGRPDVKPSGGDLGGLFGGTGGKTVDRSVAKTRSEGGLGGLLGGGGSASGNLGGADMGDIMSNPLFKAALGGIAAMAMKKMFK